MWSDRAVSFYALSTEDHAAFLAGLIRGEANYNLIHEREKEATTRTN